ncbi:MAG: hypothetical protein KJ018_14760 [Burkholderiales bacterium]|nr:hypothetical protein [Burkholderiales bacterium]
MADLTVPELRALIAESVADAAESLAARTAPVLTRVQVLARIGKSRWWWQQVQQQERALGVRLLPPEIDGIRGRFRRDDVDRWVRRGLPVLRDRRETRLRCVS